NLKGSYADSAERLHLYGNVLADLTTQITDLMGPRLRERNVWTAIKAVYSSFVAQSRAWEIGESFFNSLTRRVFATEGVDQAIEFVDSDFDAPPTSSPLDVLRIYSGAALAELILAALTDPEAGGFAAECWNELGVSVQLAAERIEVEFPDARRKGSKVRLEMINRAFYRGRGAYLVGRAIRDGGDGVGLPLAFCVRHPDESGLTLDAVLMGEGDLAILFSYTRAYFRVAAPSPYDLVKCLR